ncbi:MAG: four helix bundle protein [Flavobacteriales bacterium]
MKESILQQKSFLLAIEVVNIFNSIVHEQKEYVMSKQLLRSGTSVGANIREAQFAYSLKDFVYKLSIARKECNETLYWLDLLNETKYINLSNKEPLYNLCLEVLKMITSSIKTAQNKLN